MYKRQQIMKMIIVRLLFTPSIPKGAKKGLKNSKVMTGNIILLTLKMVKFA